ncbi:MAG: response regulator transcription factor [Candidatus Promineifilaceae bacterium]
MTSKNMSQASNGRPVILAIDDNAYTLRIVQHTLDSADFETRTAVSGEEALEVIAEIGLPDLAVVDLHLPGGMSGFEFCRSIHQFSDLPAIMLTAVDEESTVLEGLGKHAEDYIVKPFSSGELIARVKGILQRMGRLEFPKTPLVVVDERLQVDFPRRDLIKNGERVSLTPTEAKLLYILLRQAGDVVMTEYILRRLWPGQTAFEDRLHVHLHRLRRKLEEGQDEDAAHEYILSERGKGYVFQPYSGVPSTAAT